MALNPLLLKALTAADSEMSLQDMLLAQLDSQDPSVAMLTKYLAQSDDDDDDDDLLDTDDIEQEALALEFEQQAKTLEATEARLYSVTQIARQMREKLDDIYGELEELQERNDSLAEALGACHLCWGEDLECEACGGRGSPGTYSPDADMFRHYVRPAIQHLQNQQTRAAPNGSSRSSAPLGSLNFAD